jgi:hypothetical protein
MAESSGAPVKPEAVQMTPYDKSALLRWAIGHETNVTSDPIDRLVVVEASKSR